MARLQFQEIAILFNSLQTKEFLSYHHFGPPEKHITRELWWKLWPMIKGFIICTCINMTLIMITSPENFILWIQQAPNSTHTRMPNKLGGIILRPAKDFSSDHLIFFRCTVIQSYDDTAKSHPSTNLWINYSNLDCSYGLRLFEGLVEGQKFDLLSYDCTTVWQKETRWSRL